LPPRLTTFREAMRELGYIEGKTVAFEVRRSESRFDQLPRLGELVTSNEERAFTCPLGTAGPEAGP
jgi:hypothetical protein